MFIIRKALLGCYACWRLSCQSLGLLREVSSAAVNIITSEHLRPQHPGVNDVTSGVCQTVEQIGFGQHDVHQSHKCMLDSYDFLILCSNKSARARHAVNP